MTAPLPLTQPQVLAFRLHRQHLLTPAPDALSAARTLVGAQAQVHSAAVLQLRARSRDATEASVHAALFDERSLVKMWGQRSTLHLVPVADLALVLALRRAHVDRYRRWYLNEGLTESQVEALAAAIPEAMLNGPMSRADLANALAPRLGEWARPWLEHSWGGGIKLAAALGFVCHGPERDREATFLRLDRWAPTPPIDEETGRADLLRRYLAVFGPAGPRDFAKFTGLSAPAVHAAFEAVRQDLMPVAPAGGRPAWALKADEETLRSVEMPSGEITVLPLFDPYLLAHADVTPVVPERHRSRVYRTAGWISAVILREGR
ncbi:MAG TPA: winged helix DNA-binding domain-containing protein, partial [Alphaproteobacteria bacterium]|nr:winged helix DNA-binding domain-containing protein [Alphaproteobacteria bacterium]